MAEAADRALLPSFAGGGGLNGTSAARGVFESALAVSDLEAVTAVDGLDVEDVLRGEAQHALDRRGHVFVHSIGKLDDDHGTFPRSANQATGDGSRAPTKLPQHNLHNVYSSNLPLRVHQAFSFAPSFRWVASWRLAGDGSKFRLSLNLRRGM